MKRERRGERGEEGEEGGVREEEERTEEYVESKTTNKKLKTKGLKKWILTCGRQWTGRYDVHSVFLPFSKSPVPEPAHTPDYLGGKR